jgi:hypothetical protein
MDQLRARLAAAQRPELLRLLGGLIVELTIRGRAHYDEADAAERLRETNEAIHRLAGHLRDLSNNEEMFTASRADGIVEQCGLLAPSTISRLQN